MTEMSNNMLTNPDDIAMNRQSRVSPGQLAAYTSAPERSLLIVILNAFVSPLTIAFLMAGLFFFIFILRMPGFEFSMNFLYLYMAGICLIAPVFIITFEMIRLRRIKQKLFEGNVEFVEGEVQWGGGRYTAITEGRSLKSIFGKDLNLSPGRYRFYILPETNALLSVESLAIKDQLDTPFEAGSLLSVESKEVENQQAGDNPELLSVLARVHHFDIPSLKYNRLGRLSFSQAVRLTLGASVYMFGAVLIAVVAVWLNSYLIQQAAPNSFIMYIFMGLALILFLSQIMYVVDVWKRKVKFMEGLVNKSKEIRTHTRSREGFEEVYYYKAGKLTWQVSKQAYNALVEGIQYRVYYATSREILVAIEPVSSQATEITS